MLLNPIMLRDRRLVEFIKLHENAMAKQPIDISTLGGRIKKARRDAGLTQEFVAEALGTTPQAVYNWERGKNETSRENLLEIAQLTGVSLAWIVSGVDDPVPTGGPMAPGAKGGRRLVPTLTMQDVADLDSALSEKSGRERTATAYPCGPRSFRLTILDDSMAPALAVGDSVIVDPDEKPRPGDIVLALPVDEEPVLRHYRETGRSKKGVTVELRPENTNWRTIDMTLGQDGGILGVVTEEARPRRR